MLKMRLILVQARRAVFRDCPSSHHQISCRYLGHLSVLILFPSPQVSINGRNSYPLDCANYLARATDAKNGQDEHPKRFCGNDNRVRGDGHGSPAWCALHCWVRSRLLVEHHSVDIWGDTGNCAWGISRICLLRSQTTGRAWVPHGRAGAVHIQRESPKRRRKA